jgi:biotin transport system permease protein
MMNQEFYNNSIFCLISPKLKLTTLTVLASLSFLISDWRFHATSLLIVSLMCSIAGIPYRKLIKHLRSTFYLLLIIFITHAILDNWQDGLKIILRFSVLIFFAMLVNLTTSISDMIDSLTSLLRPLTCIGVNVSKVSLALSLMIRFIPLVISIFQEVQIAQKARGLENNLIANIIPAIIKTLKMADNIAEAIEARCWE